MTFANIDLPLLKQQKAYLLKLVLDGNHDTQLLNGAVHLLDYVQDEAESITGDLTGPPNLGITQEQIDKMQKRVSKLERENQAIEPTTIRQAIDQRLVEIRLLLRDGSLKGMWKRKIPPQSRQ